MSHVTHSSRDMKNSFISTFADNGHQPLQKHLGLFLDEKLSLLEHIEEKIKKAIVEVNLMRMRKMNLLLLRSSLLTVYKCFSDLIWTMEMRFTINQICLP